MKKTLSMLSLSLFFVGALPAAAFADEWHGHSTASYVGSALANPVYFPAKLAFALVGGIASGITYVATLGGRSPPRISGTPRSRGTTWSPRPCSMATSGSTSSARREPATHLRSAATTS
jgi:hypothetical protein